MTEDKWAVANVAIWPLDAGAALLCCCGRCAVEWWSMVVSSLEATMDLYISTTSLCSKSVSWPGRAAGSCFRRGTRLGHSPSGAFGSDMPDAFLDTASMPPTYASRIRASSRAGDDSHALATRTRTRSSRRSRSPHPAPPRRAPPSCCVALVFPPPFAASSRWYLRLPQCDRIPLVNRIGNASTSIDDDDEVDDLAAAMLCVGGEEWGRGWWGVGARSNETSATRWGFVRSCRVASWHVSEFALWRGGRCLAHGAVYCIAAWPKCKHGDGGMDLNGADVTSHTQRIVIERNLELGGIAIDHCEIESGQMTKINSARCDVL
uniref:Uncharacterized protein n=1 Tax=Oryza nivara TaxID=4536 RepID=A0A0E0HIW2_ORYNI